MAIEICTPLGRLVQGHPDRPQTTDDNGQPLVFSSGPNAGQPRSNYFMAIAIPKNDPAWPEFIRKLYAEARMAWPNFFTAPGNPALYPYLPPDCTPPTIPAFAFKVKDGDGYDSKGKHRATMEGFAGCWIMSFGNGFAPKIVKDGAYVPTDAVKTGDWVHIGGTYATNKSTQTPGMFANGQAVFFGAWGEEIASGGIDALAMASRLQKPAVLPPGASLTPPPSNSAPLQPPAQAQYTAPPQQAQYAPPPQQLAPPPVQQPQYVAPAPVQQPYVAPAPVQPDPSFAQQALQPPPMVAPVVAALRPTPAAGAFTYDQWRATGRTDEMLIAEGLFTR